MTPSDYNGYNISCFGSATGSINLTITGGTPPYTIIWSNAATTEDLSNVPAGYYRVNVDDADTLTDAIGAEITLTEPRHLSIVTTPYKYPNGFNISLYGACNGNISNIVSDGVPPYTYLWTDGSTTKDRSSICAADYKFTVTDNNNCKVNSELIVMKEPERGNWQLSGNQGISPLSQYIGTADATDLVFKTNNTEGARLKANGEFNINRLVAGRIVSPDSLIYFGDSTIIIHPTLNRIYGDDLSAGWKGTAIGKYANSPGLYSTSIGYKTSSQSSYSIAMGYRVQSTQEYAIVIGSGTTGNNLTNNIANSIMLGCNSQVPTVFVSSANGGTTTGNVGIGTTTPTYKLHIKHDSGTSDGIILESTNINNANSEIKFVHNGTPKWSIGSNLQHNAINRNFFIYDNEAYSNTGATRFYIDGDGRVGIGMIPPTLWSTNVQYKLYVAEGIATRDIKVTNNSWPDYVFEESYPIMSIRNYGNYFEKYKHLPGMPTAAEIEAQDGFELGAMQVKLLEKVEEQALYIVDLQNQIDELKNTIGQIQNNSRRNK